MGALRESPAPAARVRLDELDRAVVAEADFFREYAARKEDQP